METTAQLAIAQSISRKYAFEHGLKANDVLGQAWEATEKAQTTWKAAKGSLKNWSYMQLRGIMATENYQPKQYGVKARFAQLDDEGYSEDGDGMALHEKISQHRDAGETEDAFIQTIRVKEALRIRAGLTPKLRAVIDAEIDGVESQDGKIELAGRVYTAARASQLGKDLPAKIAAASENPLGLACGDGMPVREKKAGLFTMPERTAKHGSHAKPMATETMSLFAMGGQNEPHC